MEARLFWKNFKLGKELDIAGRFIYNGLETFHKMKHFAYEEEIFEFLYFTSVGIERLLKIAVILIEHEDNIDQCKFEKTLITHNHQELLGRIKKKYPLNLSPDHSKFLDLLVRFYKTSRYDRYNLKSIFNDNNEQQSFIKFLDNALSISIDTTTWFAVTANDKKIKQFMGIIIGKISSNLYDIIKKESSRLHVYTYEIKYTSKAAKIFLAQEYDFTKEDILRRELLVYFINSNQGGQSNFMKSIKPLNFDPALEINFIEFFDYNKDALELTDELEALYESEVQDEEDRIKNIEAIGWAHFNYDEEQEDL